MNKGYLLTAATAFALGAGSVQLANLSLHAASPQARAAEAVATYSMAQASAATGAQMASAACSQIDAALGLTGADRCSIQDLTSICLFLRSDDAPGQVVLRAQAQLSGTWTRGRPE